MNYSYFPGCTLKNKARDLDEYARKCAVVLGVGMEELDEWQCCGAVYPQAQDEIATRLSSVRALMAARDRGEDLITVCSACHHVIKRVNFDMKNNSDIRAKVNNYLNPAVPYAGETRVVHYLEMLRDDVGFDALRHAVQKPLKGRRIAAFYGCLLLRPSGAMAFDDPENPTIIEDFIRALGATPVIYSCRNECCGGYVTLEDRDQARKQVERVMASAIGQGAQEIITACPLCMYNLDANAPAQRLPVRYFTELMAEALGVK